MSETIQRTPSGDYIRFQTKPYRRYHARRGPCTPLELASKDGWGKKMSSVTEILGILDKPGLPWWGMTMGVEGVLELVKDGIISLTEDDGELSVYYDKTKIEAAEAKRKKAGKDKDKQPFFDDPELVTDMQKITRLLTIFEITVNHKRDNAADRGTKAHTAFETWAKTGVWTAVESFPEEQQPFVEGLHKFFAETKLEKVQAEVMVCSFDWQFAGRYDLRAIMTNKRFGLNQVKSLTDLKTSKRVYVSHFLQAEGYEGAGIEVGYKPSDKRFIVHCTIDGDYEIIESEATYDDFTAAIQLQRVIKRMGGL